MSTSSTASTPVKVKTKQKLINAGIERFALRGFNGVTISELEEAAGLKPSTGSFYRHFADKKELFITIMEQELKAAKKRRLLELDALNNDESDIRTALKQQFKLTLEGMHQNQKIYSLIIREQEEFPDLFKRMRHENIENALISVVEHYTKKIAKGAIVKLDPIALTILVESALFGFSQTKSFYSDSLTQDFENKLIETLLDLIVIKR